MKGRTIIILIIVGVALLVACSRNVTAVMAKDKELNTNGLVGTNGRMISSSVRALPPVLIYRMKGDYADLVPVSLDSDGQLVSYPDPVDITPSQRPVSLGDGWYLDRRGVGANTAFTSYTYDEYHALKHVPSQAELKAHVIDKEGIIELWSCGTGRLSVERCRQLVKDGFPGCKRIK